MQFQNDEFQAKITQEGELYVLTWGDYLFNTWREEFNYMSHAVIRLGLLIEAVEETKLFATTPKAFANDVKAFMSKQLEKGN